jgi:hypothetical protein
MQARLRSRLVDLAIVLSSTAVVLATVSAGAVWRFGSIDHTRAYLRGEVLVVEPSVIGLGEVNARSEVVRPVSLTNLTSEPIRLMGANTTCEFALSESLPMDIGPGESRSLKLLVRPGFGSGDLEYTYEFYVDQGRASARVYVVGKVGGGSGEPPLVGK